MAKRFAIPDKSACVACGVCTHVCPRAAISVLRGCYAVVNRDICVGCGLCATACPADVISFISSERRMGA